MFQLFLIRMPDLVLTLLSYFAELCNCVAMDES
jgi:hypothetical protein